MFEIITFVCLTNPERLGISCETGKAVGTLTQPQETPRTTLMVQATALEKAV